MLSTQLGQSPDADVTTMLWWASSGAAASGAIAFLAHRTVFRSRETTPVKIWTVAVYFGNHVPSAFLYEYGRQQAGMAVDGSLLSRIVALVVTQSLVAVSITLLFDYWYDVKAQRDSLVETRIQATLLDQSRADLYRQLQKQLDYDTRRKISEKNPDLLSVIDQATQPTLVPYATDIGHAITDFSQRVVKPLSRSLWEMTATPIPRVNLRQALSAVISRQPFNTLALCIFVLVSSGPPTLARTDLWRAALYLLIGLTIIVVVASSTNRLMACRPRRHTAIFMATFVVFQSTTLLMNTLHPWFGLDPVSGSSFASQIVGSAAVIIVTSALGAWHRETTDVLESAAGDVNDELISAIASSRSISTHAQELARLLHGSVQTRLTACSMSIERSIRDSDETALNLALLEAVAILKAPLPDVEIADTVGEEIGRKVALWNGLCAIDVEMDPATRNLAPPNTRDIGRVAEEAMSNAIRHGGASNLTLAVYAADNGSIVVRLDDNGTRPDQSAAGIGSAMFTQATRGDWSLTATESGTRFEAAIPTA